MSEDAQETGLLVQMKKQHQIYCSQRDQAQINFQQLIGAIFALENMIQAHEEELKAQLQEIANEAQGVSEDVQANNEVQE
jgi:hypothetical protein